MICVYALAARSQLTSRKILSYNAMHKFSLQFICWNHSRAGPVASLRSRFLSAAHRGRDTLNKRQSNIYSSSPRCKISASSDAPFGPSFRRDEKSHEKWGMNRRRSWVRGRFDASNLIYRGRRHRPVIEEGETTRTAAKLAGSLASHASRTKKTSETRSTVVLSD